MVLIFYTAAEVIAANMTDGRAGNDAFKGPVGYCENLLVIGQAVSNTVIYRYDEIRCAYNHTFRIPQLNPDTNGNHSLDANRSIL